MPCHVYSKTYPQQERCRVLGQKGVIVCAACREKELRRIADGGLRAPGRVAPQAPDDEDLEAHLLQRDAGCAKHLGLGF
jgi:hypothetical protein